LSYALQRLGKLAAALPAAREALEIRAGGKPSFAIGTPEARWACGTCSTRPKGGRGIERAAAAQQLASIEIEMGQLDNAKRHLDETLAYLSDAESDDGVRIEAYSSLGKLASARGDAEGSLHWYEQILPLRKSLLSGHETDLAMDYNNVATSLYNLNRYRESEEAYSRAIELLRGQLGDSHPKLEFVQCNRIPPLIQLGRFKEARVLLEAAEIARSASGGSTGDTPSSVPTERSRALLDYYASDFPSALHRLETALPQTRLSSPASVPEILVLRGRVELANGDPAAAAKSFEEADEMLVKEGPSEYPQHWYARGLLGVARAANGEIETGDAQLDKALVSLTRNGIRGSAEQIEISLYAGAAARRRGEIAVALTLHRRADSMQKELGWLGDLGAAHVDAELAQDGLVVGADAECRATAGTRLASAISALRSISANDRVLATLTALQSTAARY
jgi:tetratricopeptide (TPR) repeat protein